MKVLITLDIPQPALEMLQTMDCEVVSWDQGMPMSAAELVQQAKDCQALLCTGMDKIDQTLLDQCPSLKIVSQYGAGYDNIDVTAATQLGIIVTNTPGTMTEATADIAFMLMMAVSRKLTFMQQSIVRGVWGAFKPRAHLGQELKGKTLGIFGLGQIGLAMGQRCKGAYDMNIQYCNRHPNAQAEKLLNATKIDFQTLLQTSDIVSVHCPLTKDTRKVFDRGAFQLMKSTAIFINTARGAVHNELDLIQALNDKIIWGAGLDVTNPEPMLKDNPLLSMENVVVTPHIGSATIEARTAMSRLAAQNILDYFANRPLAFQVN